MSDQTAAPAEEQGESILKVLLPYLAVTALVAATLVLAVLKVTGVGSSVGGRQNAVVFDVIKLANAQRAVASAMIKPSEEASENAQLLLDVSKRTRAAIVKVAGENTLVLVKQGVVSPELPDITEDVLKELGLPTKVPTQDTMTYLTDVAPTYLSMMKQPQKQSSGTLPEAKTGSVLP
jgi:hypothetical protein